ncbi:hypothetical protein LTR56_002416 [Elasticomyces elasticus]|nr:hypothetical protein LTR56_002416 [Elasticomyces elasticus]KAK3665980.1 hypothetical protein LTR22_003299 [Elasticomyces elasticus]KAK4929452.1 hypothetical protein LTR49_004056 [Elasticomyces elasticus]KAK5744259.1 hypothetical protein LTS12_023576 [Elasticomyces elasticus]
MVSLDTIAPELRLLIYAEALEFNGTLERTMHKEDEGPKSFARLTVIADTGILCVSRKPLKADIHDSRHEEALPLFYELKPIRINHYDTCLAGGIANTALSCNEDLLTTAELTVHDDACRCLYEGLGSLLQWFDGTRYPKLRVLRIEVNSRAFGLFYQSVSRVFRNTGMQLRYTGVAKLEIALPSNFPRLTIQTTSAIKAWDGFSQLSVQELEAWKVTDRPVWMQVRERNDRSFLAWARIRAGPPLERSEAWCVLNPGIEQAELEAQELSSDTYKKMSEFLR